MENRLRRCYELAGNFVSDNRNYELIHGWIVDKNFGTGNRIPHAWCRNIEQGTLYEPVLDIELPVDAFKILFNPEIDVVYSSAEARKQMVETGHYGAWHEIDETKIILNKK